MKKIFQRKWFKRTSIVLGILLVALIALGSFYYSKSAVIDRYVVAKSKKNGGSFENIKAFLVWDDTDEIITNDQAAFASFTPLPKSEISSLKKELKSATASDPVYIKSIGHRFWIFPDYRVAMKPMSLTLKTNVPNMDLLLNQKKVATSNSENFTTELKRLPIADYSASINGTYKDKKIKVTKKYDGQKPVLDLSVTFKNFTVSSNLTEGELYFDEDRVGTLKKGQYQVIDYPITNGSKAFVKRNFPDGELKSEKADLEQVAEGSELKLTVDNLLDRTKAGEYLLAAFNQLMAYTSSRQDSATVADVFENGINNDFYKGLKESVKAKLETDGRKASSFAIPNVVLNAMTQVGKESYLLDFAATYDFAYPKETDPEKGSSGNIIQELSGQLTLKKSGDRYVISQAGTKNISVTSEKNNIKKPSLLPDGIVGTWKGTKDDITYTLTISEDGTVTRHIDFKDPKKADESRTAKITKTEEKNPGDFQVIITPETDSSILIIGGGIGGANIKYAYGLHLDGNQLTPIIWQTGMDKDFDFSKPAPGLPLTKQ